MLSKRFKRICDFMIIVLQSGAWCVRRLLSDWAERLGVRRVSMFYRKGGRAKGGGKVKIGRNVEAFAKTTSPK